MTEVWHQNACIWHQKGFVLFEAKMTEFGVKTPAFWLLAI
jgi:hypothetical protein